MNQHRRGSISKFVFIFYQIRESQCTIKYCWKACKIFSGFVTYQDVLTANRPKKLFKNQNKSGYCLLSLIHMPLVEYFSWHLSFVFTCSSPLSCWLANSQLRLIYIQHCIWLMRTYCIAQRALLSALWRSQWERNLKNYMRMYNWFIPPS